MTGGRVAACLGLGKPSVTVSPAQGEPAVRQSEVGQSGLGLCSAEGPALGPRAVPPSTGHSLLCSPPIMPLDLSRWPVTWLWSSHTVTLVWSTRPELGGHGGQCWGHFPEEPATSSAQRAAGPAPWSSMVLRPGLLRPGLWAVPSPAHRGPGSPCSGERQEQGLALAGHMGGGMITQGRTG